MDSKRVEEPQSRFCIGFHQDGNLSVQTCTRIKDDKKFYFYPYIAMTSAFFLLLTVIVYTAYPKGGLSDGRSIFNERRVINMVIWKCLHFPARKLSLLLALPGTRLARSNYVLFWEYNAIE